MDGTAAAAQHSVSPPPQRRRELPGSQESADADADADGLPTSSNASTSTAASTATDTEPASSATSIALSSQPQPPERAGPPASPPPTQDRGRNGRIDTANAPPAGDTAASPMPLSLHSPLPAQGSKRTANGLVKDASPPVAADSAVAVALAVAPSPHKRNKSTETRSSNPRIGELSAQLKTRLSYAMVKVQNGWENKSLEDLEDETSQRGSPMSIPGRGDGARLSPHYLNRPRRPSGISESSDCMMPSPGQRTPSDMSRSLAATPSIWPNTPDRPYGVGSGAMLAPAAEFSSRRKRRSSASFPPPPLLGSAQRKHWSDLGGMPHTPMAAQTAQRPGILRMPSQQAEKDAVDTLLFMSSPNNSGRLPHTNRDAAPHPSPLKSEIPARRVMFENNIPRDKPGDARPPNHGESAQYAMYRRSEPGR